MKTMRDPKHIMLAGRPSVWTHWICVPSQRLGPSERSDEHDKEGGKSRCHHRPGAGELRIERFDQDHFLDRFRCEPQVFR